MIQHILITIVAVCFVGFIGIDITGDDDDF